VERYRGDRVRFHLDSRPASERMQRLAHGKGHAA
jgi:hypothetical protein